MAQLIKTLQPVDFVNAAKLLRCDVPAIKAVCDVESEGQGFIPSGLMVLRFEGHEFRKRTKGKFDKQYPTLSHPYMEDCPYNKGTRPDWVRLEEARRLAGDVAFECASYGMFQIMGYHYDLLGYDSAWAMMIDFNKSEANQLKGFCQFVIGTGLAPALRQHRWAAFAEPYNGENYKANKYDTKLASRHLFHTNELNAAA